MGSLGFNEVTLEAMIRNLKIKASFLIKQLKKRPKNSPKILGHKNKIFPILNCLIQISYKM